MPTQTESFATAFAPQNFHIDIHEAELFQRELNIFLPAEIYDIHAHLYQPLEVARGLSREVIDYSYSQDASLNFYRERQQTWMGSNAPRDGLFFAFPARHLDVGKANNYLYQEVSSAADSRGLLLIKPSDDPQTIEEKVLREQWAGFKVYHVYAPREDTQNAEIGEFLPEWAWDISNKYGLLIMLHMVRQFSLSDEKNQQYINQFCHKYSNAQLVLAHAARGFCGRHTVNGIQSIAELDNVYFDSSAICEAAPLRAILKTFGPTRLLYGSDFPVSEIHGRAVSLGDSFHWIYEWDKEKWDFDKPMLTGIESLLALKEACESTFLNESDLRLIFNDNARRLLTIETKAPQKSDQEYYCEAKKIIPGGTQLLSKRPEMYAPQHWPPYFREARGCEIITNDNKRFVDFTTNGIGSCLLGFSHPEVVKAVSRRVQLGVMSTLNPPEEVELAKRLLSLNPWAQNVRFGRMGGETMSIAVRLARAFTGRDIIAFCGYHGWNDWYLAANLNNDHNNLALNRHLLPGLQPLGVPQGLHGTAIPFNYNDLESLQKIVAQHGKNLAAVVMEPIRNYDPSPGFFDAVRALCDESGAQLIFDEITAGFRLHRSGAHLRYNAKPDIAVYAKTLGNGHPMAAVVGRSDVMQIAQQSFLSSTYWTESVGPVAALATQEVLSAYNVPAHVENIGKRVRRGLKELAIQHDLHINIMGHPALTSWTFAYPENAVLMTLYTRQMLEKGFLAGGVFYPTLSHQESHVEEFLQAAGEVFLYLAEILSKKRPDIVLDSPVRHSGFVRLN